MKFQFQVLCLLALLSCVLVSLSYALEEPVRDSRSSVELPKLFDFERFKSVFRKKYSSIVEELVRKKIFLGRAIRAFLSMIKYKRFQADKYLKISELSDKTESEFKRTLKRRPLSGLKDKSVSLSDLELAQMDQQTPVASESEIKAKLNEPEFAAIKVELSAGRRRRRDAAKRSQLTADYLLDEPEFDLPEDELVYFPSNNPKYRAPELTSFGAEEELIKAPMSEQSVSLISQLPGASYINSLFSSLNFFGGEQAEVLASHKQGSRKLPDEVFVDHRESGCFLTPKNQGDCGSCYIFSATALFEWQMCHEQGNKLGFSEQYPLDCGERSDLEGCNGGQETDVAKFYGTYGVEMKGKYPYRQQSDICPYEPDTSDQVMGYLKLRPNHRETGGMVAANYEKLEKVLAYNPVVIGIGVPDDFSDYGGGVDNGKGCKETNGHSMVIAGHGREDGSEYWLFRNSYGTSWGEKGHYKLNKKAKHCLMDDGMFWFLYGRGRKGKIFQERENTNNDPSMVKSRYLDVVNHRPVERNPFTYLDPEDADPNAVTPPSANRG